MSFERSTEFDVGNQNPIAIYVTPIAALDRRAREVHGNVEFTKPAFLRAQRHRRERANANLETINFIGIAHGRVEHDARPSILCRRFRKIATEQGTTQGCAAIDDEHAPLARRLDRLLHERIVFKRFKCSYFAAKYSSFAKSLEHGREHAQCAARKFVFMGVAEIGGRLHGSIVFRPRITMTANVSRDELIVSVKHWLETAVIGLNLCPFAKAVHVKDQIRYVVSEATNIDTLADDLVRELEALAEANPEKIDTTLLILPNVLQDFLDFNDFLDVADEIVEELELDGILQVAPFHPQFQFEDTETNDITNYTNRSPYPILHLLREDSVTRAVEAFPDELEIAENNIATLRKLGHAGWKALFETK